MSSCLGGQPFPVRRIATERRGIGLMPAPALPSLATAADPSRGFGTGGSLALWVAGHDETIAGVASFSARAHFDDWAENWELLLEHVRSLGMIRSPDYPDDPETWRGEMQLFRPMNAMPKLPPRPVLIVHGADDRRVPSADARELATAARGQVDLRIVAGAGHRLRHDPRIVALLLGWLDRQTFKGARSAAM